MTVKYWIYWSKLPNPILTRSIVRIKITSDTIKTKVLLMEWYPIRRHLPDTHSSARRALYDRYYSDIVKQIDSTPPHHMGIDAMICTADCRHRFNYREDTIILSLYAPVDTVLFIIYGGTVVYISDRTQPKDVSDICQQCHEIKMAGYTFSIPCTEKCRSIQEKCEFLTDDLVDSTGTQHRRIVPFSPALPLVELGDQCIDDLFIETIDPCRVYFQYIQVSDSDYEYEIFVIFPEYIKLCDSVILVVLGDIFILPKDRDALEDVASGYSITGSVARYID